MWFIDRASGWLHCIGSQNERITTTSPTHISCYNLLSDILPAVIWEAIFIQFSTIFQQLQQRVEIFCVEIFICWSRALNFSFFSHLLAFFSSFLISKWTIVEVGRVVFHKFSNKLTHLPLKSVPWYINFKFQKSCNSANSGKIPWQTNLNDKKSSGKIFNGKFLWRELYSTIWSWW